MAQGGAFLRSATGLVREFNASDIAILSVGAIAPGFAWIFFFNSAWFVFPGVNIPVSLLIIAVLALVQGLFYALMTSAFPRSGGVTYVAVSRVLNPAVGLAMPFVFFAYQIFTCALTATVVIGVGLNSQLSAFAAVTGNTGLANFAASISSSGPEALLCGILVVVSALVVISGTRYIKVLNIITFALITVVIISVLYILGTTSQAQFQADVNAYAGSGSYQAIITNAHSGGWAPPTNWLVPTLASLPLSWFFLSGYQNSNYYGGEIRRVGRTLAFAAAFSIGFSIAVYAAFAILIENSFGTDFINSANFLFNTGSSNALSIAPYPNDMVLLINSNPILNYLMIMSFLLAGFAFIVTVFLQSSRLLLAWSFDRVIPSAFGSVSDRFHAPARAILFCVLLFLISTTFFTYFPAYQATVGTSFIAVAGVVLDGLTGVFLPIRKALFNSAPAMVRRKVGGVPIIAILGGYSFVFTAYMFYALLANTSIGGPLSSATEGAIIIAFGLGIVTYFGAKSYQKARGVDIGLSFKEIPPE